jgi:hypothetical protein
MKLLQTPYDLHFVVAAAAAALMYALLRALGRMNEAWRDSPYIVAMREILEVPCSVSVDLPVKIMPHLFLGDKRSAGDPHLLDALGITHVLNVAGRYGVAEAGRDHLSTSSHYLQIDAADEEDYPILPRHYREASAFIRRARDAGGRCLIHCYAGINRSGCLAVAELMCSERLPLLESVHRVKEARGVLLSNEGFQAQLVTFARAQGWLGPAPVGVAPQHVARRPKRRSAAEALRGLS